MSSKFEVKLYLNIVHIVYTPHTPSNRPTTCLAFRASKRWLLESLNFGSNLKLPNFALAALELEDWWRGLEEKTRED